MTSGRSQLNRRTFLKSTGIGASAALLAGCAKGTGNAAAAPNTITMAGWDDGFNDLLVGPIAKAFKAKSGVALQSQAAVAFGDFQTRFRTLLAGGSPPDVMRLNDDFLREVSTKKLAKDIGPYLKKGEFDLSDYYENVFNFSKLASGQRAVQIASQVRSIFYNKTMFEKLGVPLPPKKWTDKGWKWADFLDTAKALTKAPNQWGAVVVKDTAFENTWSVNNGGPGIFSADGHKFTLADPEGYEAMQWCSDLITKHRVSPAWGDIQADQAEMRLFASGKLGMLFGASSGMSYFQENVKDFEWDIAPVPGQVHQYEEGGMVVYIIPDKGKNPDQAWDFLNFCISPEGGKLLAETGLGVPVNKEAAKSIKSPGKYPDNIKMLAEAANYNKSVNSTSATAAAVAIYRPQLQRAFTGDITVKQALISVRGQVEAAIKGN